MKSLSVLLLVSALVPPAAAQEAAGRTVIEGMIAARNPCASLRTEVAGQTIGVDVLDEIELPQADAALRGDAVTLSFSGRLSCRTPPEALIEGDASAAVAAEAELSLADCAGAALSVGLSDFGGTFAAVLEALDPVLEAQMVETARPMLVEACQRLRGEGP